MGTAIVGIPSTTAGRTFPDEGRKEGLSVAETSVQRGLELHVPVAGLRSKQIPGSQN